MPFGFGRGGRHGRSRRGRMRRPNWANEKCVCPACNTVILHQRGTPCFETACPNCGAAMTRQFNTEITDMSPTKSAPIKPVVVANLCTGCGKCLSACNFEAIEMIDQKAVIKPELCTNCRACIPVCPVSAIH